MPRTYVDDNFGVWSEMDDPDNVEFYHQVQKQSRWKTCKGCGRRVKIKPEYAICNACAERRELGGEY